MKRFLAAFIILTMSFAFLSVAAADSEYYDTPLTASVIRETGMTSADVMETSFNRAAVTVLLLCDLGLSGSFEADWSSDVSLADSYIGVQNDGILVVMMPVKNSKFLCMLYSTELDSTAIFYTSDWSGDGEAAFDKVATQIYEGVGVDKYYKNSASDLLQVMQLLSDSLS